ncbi:MAG: hypothetical protein M3370_10370 [Actinomycetota bacterium]|nr:hypothetical protein [Actinomycetota bacterium]
MATIGALAIGTTLVPSRGVYEPQSATEEQEAARERRKADLHAVTPRPTCANLPSGRATKPNAAVAPKARPGHVSRLVDRDTVEGASKIKRVISLLVKEAPVFQESQ